MQLVLIFCLFSALLAGDAIALEPDEVFRQAAPSVVMIFAQAGKTGSQGSGVVVSPGRVVTNCHVALDKAQKPMPKLVVGQVGQKWAASYIAGNLDYDTCLLAVPGLTAPSALLANPEKLRIGQRVYAIGAPSGLELTLTDGLLSGIRPMKSSRVIQTSAAISPGSSGGGLFDDQARLIGITSFGLKGANGLNFAYFADPIISLVAASARSDGEAGLAQSVQAALTKVVADSAPAQSSFRSPVEAADWIGTMSLILEASVPNRAYRIDLLRSIHFEATRAGLDAQLVLALIDTISGFRKFIVTEDGARGYMLVQPAWVRLVGRADDNLFDLRTNLRYGCTILRHYLDIEQGDLRQALLRYELAMHKGPGQDLKITSAFPDKVRSTWQNRWALNRRAD